MTIADGVPGLALSAHVLVGASLILSALLAVGIVLWIRGRPSGPVDHDRARIGLMYSTTYRLSGRAERIHEEDDGTLVATIRIDRDRGVYESDRKVAAATALAARGSKYSVTRVRVETNSDAREFDFPSEDEQLALHIRGEMAEAREIKSGNGGEARPTPARCFSCEYAYACSESQSGT